MKQEFWNYIQQMRKFYAQSLEQVCRDWSLTRAEMDVLLFLANNPQSDRAADIVELRGLTKSHVSIAVKQLYERGFLEAQQDGADHRVVHLKPTGAAGEAIAAGQESQRAYLERMFAGFSRKEMEEFRRLQEKLYANMKAMGAE